MPALFVPTLGGLAIHFGRAPWVNVLYYTAGRLGLRPDVAALYVPPSADSPSHIHLANATVTPVTIAVRKIDPVDSTRLSLPAPSGLPEITLDLGAVADVVLS